MGNKIAKYYADDELPDLLEVAAGAAYMKEVHSKDAAYDRWQYKFWMQYLEGIALSRFEWHDLPEGIDRARLNTFCITTVSPDFSLTMGVSCSPRLPTGTA